MSIQDIETKVKAEFAATEAMAALWLKTNKKAAIALVVAAAAGAFLAKLF